MVSKILNNRSESDLFHTMPEKAIPFHSNPIKSILHPKPPPQQQQ